MINMLEMNQNLIHKPDLYCKVFMEKEWTKISIILVIYSDN